MPRSQDVFDKLEENFKPKNIEEFLAVNRSETIGALTDSIDNVIGINTVPQNKSSTGVLRQSIDIDITSKPESLRYQIKMEEYGKFLDEGVNGRLRKFGAPYSFKKGNIPRKAAMEFIAAKGITQWKNKSGKVVIDVNKISVKVGESKSVKRANKFKALAFVAGRAIANYGIKPTHFFTDVINDEWQENLKDDIGKQLAKGFE
jgi:hypothetical protein